MHVLAGASAYVFSAQPADDLRKLCTGDPERLVFQVRTRPQWGRQESLTRDASDILQHSLRRAAITLGFYRKGFVPLLAARGFDGDWIRVGNWAGDADGPAQRIDMTMVYQLEDKAEQERCVRAFRKELWASPKGLCNSRCVWWA